MGVSVDESFFAGKPNSFDKDKEYYTTRSDPDDFTKSRQDCGERHLGSLSVDLQKKLSRFADDLKNCRMFVLEALPRAKRVRAEHGAAAGLLKFVDIKGAPFTLVQPNTYIDFYRLGMKTESVDLYEYISGRRASG